jgi:hypothetical protein
MNSKLKLLLFVVSLAALLLFQSKAVIPFVHHVVSSDIFLKDSPDEANSMTISTEMTHIAFQHCNTYIGEDINSDFSVSFAEKATNAWAMGDYQYIVNADINIKRSEDGENFTRSYVCRIQYTEKDDLTKSNEFENWSINGVSGLDNL